MTGRRPSPPSCHPPCLPASLPLCDPVLHPLRSPGAYPRAAGGSRPADAGRQHADARHGSAPHGAARAARLHQRRRLVVERPVVLYPQHLRGPDAAALNFRAGIGCNGESAAVTCCSLNESPVMMPKIKSRLEAKVLPPPFVHDVAHRRQNLRLPKYSDQQNQGRI